MSNSQSNLITNQVILFDFDKLASDVYTFVNDNDLGLNDDLLTNAILDAFQDELNQIHRPYDKIISILVDECGLGIEAATTWLDEIILYLNQHFKDFKSVINYPYNTFAVQSIDTDDYVRVYYLTEIKSMRKRSCKL